MKKKHVWRPVCLAAMAGLLVMTLLPGCAGRSEWHEADGSVFGTVYHVKWRGPASLEDSVLAAFAAVDGSLSMFHEGSTVWRINAGDTTVRADSLTRRVLRASKIVHGMSRGAFDPTVGPLVEAWGFGSRRFDEGWTAPTPALIDSLLRGVGITRVRVDAEGRVQLPAECSRLDFSAIAKGYACDLAGEALQRGGCDDYMVEIGGEIAQRGVNERGEPWHIMIETPAVDGQKPGERRGLTMLENPLAGVATSGNYRNYRELTPGDSAARVGHTINPRTGMPARQQLLSATVTARSCLLADALATACMAMHPDSAAAMLGRAGAKGVFVLPGLKVVTVP